MSSHNFPSLNKNGIFKVIDIAIIVDMVSVNSVSVVSVVIVIILQSL